MKAVKADEAAVEIEIWNDRLTLLKGDVDESVWAKSLDLLRIAMLRRYRWNVRKSFLHYLTTSYGEQWQALVEEAVQ
eukprot:15361946-Ditylum_brightwellii.AAC.1